MNYKKKVLKNGLRIITVPMQDNATATVLVLVEAGSKYENEKNRGISHFLEHMCFKGTQKRPTAKDINIELDGLGAEINAFTGHEFTGYYAKVHYKKADRILDIISDIYLNPVFDEKEIEKEKGVIIEEINMYKDLPMAEVKEMFMALLYGEQAVGFPIAGEKETVKKITKDNFIDYRSKHYVASATTVVVAGKFDEKEIVKNITEKFSGIKTNKKESKEKVFDEQSEPRVVVKSKKSDQTHLVLGVRTFDFFNKDSIVASMISAILGAGMSSRLFHKLREEMGVCYYVKTGNNTFTDHGFLGISAGVDNKRMTEVVGVILDEFKKMKEELISEEELKKVKDFLIGNLFLDLESSDSFADFYGMQEILNRPIDKPKDKVKKIKAVTAEDIKRVANKIFVQNNLNLAVIGAVKESDKEKLVNSLSV